jgi:predicted transcriptional regulator
MAVLRVLWERGPLTAREITSAIYPDGGETEFASVHSFLQRLERKGLVGRDRSGFVHLFTAAVSQADVAGRELAALADRLSGGSLAPFLMHLLDRQRLTEKEASEIRRMLDAYEPPSKKPRQTGRKRRAE